MNKKNSKNEIWIFVLVILIIVSIMAGSIIIGTISNSIKSSTESKHEEMLIKDGKTKTSNEVIDEIIELLKNKNESELEKYLSDNFIYYDNNNYGHKYLSYFLDDLGIYTTSYEIERRNDTFQDDIATYKVYWNVVEENKNKGIDKTNQYYCLQKIAVILRRIVKQDIITYEIEKIVLINN